MFTSYEELHGVSSPNNIQAPSPPSDKNRLLSSPAEWLGPNQCAGTCQNTPGTVAGVAALLPRLRGVRRWKCG